MDENFKVKGSYNIQLYDEFGSLKDVRTTDNTVTNAGFDALIQRGYSTQAGSDAINWLAIGSGSIAVAVGNTTLGSEAARVQGTYGHTDGQHNFFVSGAFAAGTATGSITEVGLLNSGATGHLFSRSTFSVVNKGASDSLAITWVGSLS